MITLSYFWHKAIQSTRRGKFHPLWGLNLEDKTHREFESHQVHKSKSKIMRELESRLQAENPRYRRIWVQYCAHRQLRALLTLFPCGHQPYEMIMGEVTDLSYESINNLLQTNIVK